MAINVSTFVTDELTEGNGTFLDDLLALNPTATPAQAAAGAQALVDLVGRGLQHVKDNAVALDGTSGGGDDLDID